MSTTPAPLVGIVMGSDSDWPLLQKGAEVLKDFGVPFEVRVMSAHRTPELASAYAAEAEKRGLQVLISAAASIRATFTFALRFSAGMSKMIGSGISMVSKIFDCNRPFASKVR